VLALLPSFLQAMPGMAHGTRHFFILLGLGMAMVFGAMVARRKVPLLAGASAMVLCTLIKAVELAWQESVLWPVLVFFFGCVVLGAGVLFEQRMNQAFRKAMDRAKAEAKMFWVSWE
jgi:CBS-domain-containing membrane protein